MIRGVLIRLALVALAPASFLSAAAAQETGGTAAISYKFTASCIPHSDLSVSDCRFEDMDVPKSDAIMKRAMAYISASHLHPNWRTTLQMDGNRVIIPFTMRLRRPR